MKSSRVSPTHAIALLGLVLSILGSGALLAQAPAVTAPPTAPATPAAAATAAVSPAPAMTFLAEAPVVPRPNTAIIPVPQRLEDRLPQNAVTGFNTRHERYAGLAKQGGIDLLFLGDSIIQAWGDRGQPVWKEYYGEMKAAAFGIGYDRTQHALWRLQNGEGEGFSPKAIVLMIGTNNIGLNTPPEIAMGVSAIVHELRTRFPSAKILLHGIFPRDLKGSRNRALVAETNKLIAPLHDGQHVHYLDITEKFLDGDGNIVPELFQEKVPLHPSPKGYAVWSEAIKEPLAKLMQ